MAAAGAEPHRSALEKQQVHRLGARRAREVGALDVAVVELRARQARAEEGRLLQVGGEEGGVGQVRADELCASHVGDPARVDGPARTSPGAR